MGGGEGLAGGSLAAQALALAATLAACFAAAWVASTFTTPAVRGGWYAGLAKPAWTPPPRVFGPVWSLLYLSMGVAAWLVWRERGLQSAPLALFALQLALNALWSAVFFGARRPGLAFAEIVLLWGAVLATAVSFRPASSAAALLLLPYLLWVTFAAALNFSVWRKN